MSGTSAGGMSAYLHSSFVKAQLYSRNPGARLVAVPDAGFWWDTPQYGYPSDPSLWLQRMTAWIAPGVWNATLRGGLAACLEAPPGGVLAKCYTQPYAYAYLDVPTFVVQSLVDPANIGAWAFDELGRPSTNFFFFFPHFFSNLSSVPLASPAQIRAPPHTRPRRLVLLGPVCGVPDGCLQLSAGTRSAARSRGTPPEPATRRARRRSPTLRCSRAT